MTNNKFVRSTFVMRFSFSLDDEIDMKEFSFESRSFLINYLGVPLCAAHNGSNRHFLLDISDNDQNKKKRKILLISFQI